MLESPSGGIVWRSRVRSLALALGILAMLAPHAHRLLHPSIYSDDVARIFVVETNTLGESLSKPFNEHVAPVFDAVTWVAWAAAGGRLPAVATMFTVAAFVPFLLSLGAIGLFARRELGSWPASMPVVVAFAVAPIHVVETVWWYSGSNHMWALLWGMVALLGVGQGGWQGAIMAVVGSLLAPACSLMGVLVAPACLLYATARRGRSWKATGLASVVGLGLYAAMGASLGLVQALLTGRSRSSDPQLGLVVAGEAPSVALVPDLLGIRDLDYTLPPAWALAVTALLVAGGLIWAWRSRDRAFILLGLFFIAGGYLLIFPFRAADGQEIMLRTARYHLFPQLGLSMLLGAGLRRAVSGRWGEWISWTVCAAMLAVHLPRQFSENTLYDFPNQARTLRALERVRAICRSEGITDRQAVAALEPIRPHWMPLNLPNANAARLIGPIPTADPVPDDQVRSRILAALIPEEREGLFGGMNVSPYLVPSGFASEDDGHRTIISRGVARDRVERSGPHHEYRTEGWPSSLEFDLDADREEIERATSLIVPVDAPEGGVEVWWDDGHGRWSSGRSVSWSIGEDRPRGLLWSVPLDRLPHWNGRRVKRLQVRFRYPGRVFVQPPRLAVPIDAPESSGRVAR